MDKGVTNDLYNQYFFGYGFSIPLMDSV